MAPRKPYAHAKLEEVLSASPEEVPPELRKSFELLLASTAGHRISKYGVAYGLTPVFQAVGDMTASPAIKDNASLIGQGVAGTVSLMGILFLRGKWTRALAFGGLFQSVEAGLDAIESLIVGAL